MRNTGNEKVGFGSSNRKSFPHSTAKRIFKQINRAFNEDAVAVKIIPVVSTTRNTGVKAQIFVGVSVNTTPVRRVGTRIITSAGVSFGDRL